MEFLFPCSNFLKGKTLLRSPLTSTPPLTKKVSLKTFVHFPITITVCKHWSKFVHCSSSPGDWGGVSHPKDMVIMDFDYVEQNGYLKIFIRRLCEKWAWEGA